LLHSAALECDLGVVGTIRLSVTDRYHVKTDVYRITWFSHRIAQGLVSRYRLSYPVFQGTVIFS